MTKKTIAREWLYFLGAIVIGFVVVPPILMLVVNPSAGLSAFYEALVDRREWWLAWLIVIAPYIIFQLGRSIAWAIRVVRE